MDVEIAVALKYLNYSWRTLKIALTNCKANVIVTLSAVCVIFVPFVQQNLK